MADYSVTTKTFLQRDLVLIYIMFLRFCSFNSDGSTQVCDVWRQFWFLELPLPAMSQKHLAHKLPAYISFHSLEW